MTCAILSSKTAYVKPSLRVGFVLIAYWLLPAVKVRGWDPLILAMGICNFIAILWYDYKPFLEFHKNSVIVLLTSVAGSFALVAASFPAAGFEQLSMISYGWFGVLAATAPPYDMDSEQDIPTSRTVKLLWGYGLPVFGILSTVVFVSCLLNYKN